MYILFYLNFFFLGFYFCHIPGELNPLSPKSDENEISLYIITTCLNVQVMRIKKVIIKDETS